PDAPLLQHIRRCPLGLKLHTPPALLFSGQVWSSFDLSHTARHPYVRQSCCACFSLRISSPIAALSSLLSGSDRHISRCFASSGSSSIRLASVCQISIRSPIRTILPNHIHARLGLWPFDKFSRRFRGLANQPQPIPLGFVDILPQIILVARSQPVLERIALEVSAIFFRRQRRLDDVDRLL